MTKEISLVGYTGFVGSNIYRHGSISDVYNSKNIQSAFGKKPDVLIYAGIRAEKYIADKFPEKDFESICNAIENIKKINPKKLVLISTIDVYPEPYEVYEDATINEKILKPYGKNRIYLEKWVEDNISEFTIIRLPGLFGENIKKNFIYDYIYRIPKLLSEKKFEELCVVNPSLREYYFINDKGFYECKVLTEKSRMYLLDMFEKMQFSALNFTDSRGIFQFYNLQNLYGDIKIALNNNLNKVNLATEPISIAELYQYLTGKIFKNEISITIPHYNFKTRYADYFGGQEGYIYNKRQILDDIDNFVKNKSPLYIER